MDVGSPIQKQIFLFIVMLPESYSVIGYFR